MSLSMLSPGLEQLGFTPFFRNQLQAIETDLGQVSKPPLVVARISCERRGQYEVVIATAAYRVALSGRLEHALADDLRPAVGDWVVVEPADPVGRIHQLLDRQSVLKRRTVGGTSRAQTLAANVDLCCVVCALSSPDADVHTRRRSLNPRRLERYLRTAHDSRIPALVLINKVDVAGPERAAEQLAQLSIEFPGTAFELVSAQTGQGMDSFRDQLGSGCTAVLLGSSGVGKSTLVNRLLGDDVQRTGQARDDDARGRHTTTERELLRLPSGGILIDTPGMRELSLWADADTDLTSTGFEDIDGWAEGCRFRDCGHHGEPGCSVLAAIERGGLAQERLEHARKLERELIHQKVQVDARLRRAQVQERKTQARAVRSRMKQKGRT